MKRDFDLVRRIMSDIEAMPAGEVITKLEYPEYDEATINQHVSLLMDENFINGTTHIAFGRIDAAIIYGLTWKGHDFLDAAKDDTIWKKAKETILKPTVSVTFTILLEWLKEEAKKKLGLP